jgi:hypothetical protein
MPIPKNYPIESFDPRFPELLLRGGRGEDFTIQCRTSSEAYRLQHMLHSYRSRARQEFANEPEKWRPLFVAVVGLERDEKGKKTRVHIFSRHNEFDALFSGVIDSPSTQLAADPLEEFDPTTAKPEGSGG